MIADIAVVAIIALCIFLGYKRGLIKVAVKILGFIASLIIALALYTPVSNYIIENTDVVSSLQSTIQSKIYSEETNEENTNENKDINETIGAYIEGYADEIKQSSSEYIAQGAAVSIVRVGTWIGLFLVARILMIFIKIFASIIEKIPIIKQFNKVRRNNIWYITRICSNICNTCNNNISFTNDGRKSANGNNTNIFHM